MTMKSIDDESDQRPSFTPILQTLHRQVEHLRGQQHKQSSYTSAFLDCLVYRHDLPNMMAEDQSIEGVPDSVLRALRRGDVPTESELARLSLEDQNRLIRDLVWIAGHGAIRWYREQGLSDHGSQLVLGECMNEWTTEDWAASYVRAALALLLACDPSPDLMDLMIDAEVPGITPLERLRRIYAELELAILSRHVEDGNSQQVNQNQTPFSR